MTDHHQPLEHYDDQKNNDLHDHTLVLALVVFVLVVVAVGVTNFLCHMTGVNTCV